MIEIVKAYTRSGAEWCSCCQSDKNTKRIRFSSDGYQGISIVLCGKYRQELVEKLIAPQSKKGHCKEEVKEASELDGIVDQEPQMAEAQGTLEITQEMIFDLNNLLKYEGCSFRYRIEKMPDGLTIASRVIASDRYVKNANIITTREFDDLLERFFQMRGIALGSNADGTSIWATDQK